METVAILAIALIVAAIPLYFFLREGHGSASKGEFSSGNDESSLVDDSSDEQTSEEVGRAFENFVVSHFSKKYFTLVDWRGDKAVGRRYAESSKLPDQTWELHFGDKKFRFATECKYRSYWLNGKAGSRFIVWAKRGQEKRYAGYSKSKKLPVFLVLGVGGSPESPAEMYVVPLRDMKSRFISTTAAAAYKSNNASGYFFYDGAQQKLTQGDPKGA